eukprot:365720-Chlamydomonas_euryale.AAC.7
MANRCCLIPIWTMHAFRVLDFLMQSSHPSTVRQERRLPSTIIIADKDVAHAKLTLVDLHSGLLAIVIEVVAAVQREGRQVQGTLFAAVNAAGQQSNTLSCWHAACWMLACFGAGQPRAAPQAVTDLLQAICCRFEEELVLSDGSMMWEHIFDGGGALYEKGDMSLVEAFLQAVAQRAASRVAAVCRLLPEPLHYDEGPKQDFRQLSSTSSYDGRSGEKMEDCRAAW